MNNCYICNTAAIDPYTSLLGKLVSLDHSACMRTHDMEFKTWLRTLMSTMQIYNVATGQRIK